MIISAGVSKCQETVYSPGSTLMTETFRAEPCSICAEPVERHTESYCNACGRLFHLNQREDLPGRDCGTVALNEAHLALEFLCDACLEATPTNSPTLDAVLDLSEAALAAGMSEPELAEAAAAGSVAHRRTAGGSLLFEREAIEGLLRARGRA